MPGWVQGAIAGSLGAAISSLVRRALGQAAENMLLAVLVAVVPASSLFPRARTTPWRQFAISGFVLYVFLSVFLYFWGDGALRGNTVLLGVLGVGLVAWTLSVFRLRALQRGVATSRGAAA